MFGRKEIYEYSIDVGGAKIGVEDRVYWYVSDLIRDNYDLKRKVETLEKRIEEITKITNQKDHKLALSRDCGDCKYVVSTRFNDIAGCRRDNVCEDFVKKESRND